jgi:hypothetical protein
MNCFKNENIKNGLRSLIILTSLTAVIVFGFSYIVVGYSIDEKESKATSFCKIFFPGNHGSMSGAKPMDDGKSFFLSIPAIVYAQNLDNVRPHYKNLKFTSIETVGFGRYFKLSTTASISPKKAHEFTLVGLKPSGTG